MRATAATQHRRTTAHTLDDLVSSIADERFVVLDLDELTDEARTRLGLPDLRLVDHDEHDAYRILLDGDVFEAVVPIAGPSGLRTIYAAATPQLVAVVQQDDVVELDDVVRRMRWDADHPGAVAVFIVVELALRSFRDAIRTTRDELDAVEDAMLERADRNQLLVLNDLHRRVSAMRRALGEYADAVTDTNEAFETDATRPPVATRLARVHSSSVDAVLGALAVVRDEVSNAMELHRSLTTTRQGLVINRLTVISALLLPLTFVTGFFGMNFGWLDEHIASSASFWLLGVLIPVGVATVVLLTMWRAGWLVVLQRDPAPASGTVAPTVRSSGR